MFCVCRPLHLKLYHDFFLASLPAENDELDGRLALAPRLAAQPAKEPMRDDILALSAGASVDSGRYDDLGPPAKKQRLSRNRRHPKKITDLEQKLKEMQSAPSGGKGNGKRGKAKSGDQETDRRAAKNEWCKFFKKM